MKNCDAVRRKGMAIKVTDTAKDELAKVMNESGLAKPALRIVFSGVG